MNWLKKVFGTSKSGVKPKTAPHSPPRKFNQVQRIPTQPPIAKATSATSQASPNFLGLDATLAKLGSKAWLPSKSRNLGASGFLFTPPLLVPRDSQSIDAAVKALYEHARLWTAGFEIPYSVPPIRVQSNIRAAGEFKVDGEGWVTLYVSSRYLDHPAAVWLIVAHEVCYHILNLSGFDDKVDSRRNEQMTDLTMFICGFGELVKAGFQVISRNGDDYTKTHLGYLEAKEYSHAYRWVIVARQRNELSGVRGIKISDFSVVFWPVLNAR